MLDWPVPEVSVLPKKLPVIRRDGDVGILRYDVKQLLHHPVQILHGLDLPLPQRLQLGVVKELFLLLLRDSTIGCLYERGDSNPYETITFARFNLKWLTAGK